MARFFVLQRKEYVLKTFLTLRYKFRVEGYGSQVSEVCISKLAREMKVSWQTAKNHIEALKRYGLIQQRKGSHRKLFIIKGHVECIKAIRKISDTTRADLGLSESASDAQYIKKLHSPSFPGVKLKLSVLDRDTKDFRYLLSGSLYIRNVGQQAHQQAKASSRELLDGKSKTAERGQIGVFLAGMLTGRSAMTGSRLRRGYQKLGLIQLVDNSTYVNEFSSLHSFYTWKDSQPPELIFIPIPKRSDHKKGIKSYYALHVQCHETVLLDQDLVLGSRVRPSSYPRRKKKDLKHPTPSRS